MHCYAVWELSSYGMPGGLRYEMALPLMAMSVLANVYKLMGTIVSHDICLLIYMPVIKDILNAKYIATDYIHI